MRRPGTLWYMDARKYRTRIRGKKNTFGMRLECPRQKIVMMIGRKYRRQKEISKFTE